MTAGEHYAIFYLYPDGWGQVAITDRDEAIRMVANGKGKVAAVDCVTDEKLEVGES